MTLIEFIRDDWEYSDWYARACIILLFPIYVFVAWICLLIYGEGEY